MEQFLDIKSFTTSVIAGLTGLFILWLLAKYTSLGRSLRIRLERRKFRAIPTLERVNALAAESYKRHVPPGRTGKGRRATTPGIWENRDWLGQVNFVETVAALGDAIDGQEQHVVTSGHQPQSSMAVVATIRKMLQRAYSNSRSAEGASCRVLIQGPPGTGKTTVLVRLYFELLGVTNSGPHGTRWSDGAPVPMLIQPRRLEVDLTAATDRCIAQLEGKSCGWFEALVQSWLQANDIRTHSDATVHHLTVHYLAEDLKQSLDAGRILLLLDGYDELSQLRLANKVNELLASPFVVYADRSEHRQTPSGVAPLRLDEFWPPATCRSYLEKAWSSNELAGWVDRVLARIGWPESAWLRNPRSFVALVGVLQKQGDGGTPTEKVLRDLIRGQYQIIEEALHLAFERLERLPGRSQEEEVWEKLGVIAAEQSKLSEQSELSEQPRNTGKLPVPSAQLQSEPVWHSVESMTEIVTRTVAGDGIELEIRPRFYHYFCGQQIWSHLAEGHLPNIKGPWSALTLAAASAKLRLDLQAIQFLWDSLDRKKLDGASPFLTLNLLNLGMRITDTDKPIENHLLVDLDLRGANLRDRQFEKCTFDRSSLKGAALQGSKFVNCSLVGTDLSQADASGASFSHCTFLDETRQGALNVRDMQIAAATFDGSDVTEGDLLKTTAGAISLHSRYRGSFGPWFAKEQRWILGGDFTDLANDYTDRKRQALQRKNPVYMIDLMAGGAVDGLRDLHTEFHNVHILALDRDTEQLDKLALPATRFNVWKVDLQDGVSATAAPTRKALRNQGTGFDLRGPMSSDPGWRVGAHLIVGKKAIHEVPRPVQQRLIDQCHAALRDEGRLVLFTDSPGSMLDEQRERLDEIRRLLEAREWPREEVIHGQSFGDTPQDVGLFCNLWVMLKDWANDNEHEVSNRYFSGHTEIEEWCTSDEKFSLTERIPSRDRKGYRLTPLKQNEVGIRFALDSLGNDSDAPNVDMETIFQKIYGSDQDRFRVLIDFTRHHLFPDRWGSPTKLGKELNAKPEEVDFGRINDRLGKWVDYRPEPVEEVTFDFPVHILVFQKRPVSTNHRRVTNHKSAGA